MSTMQSRLFDHRLRVIVETACYLMHGQGTRVYFYSHAYCAYFVPLTSTMLYKLTMEFSPFTLTITQVGWGDLPTEVIRELFISKNQAHRVEGESDDDGS